MSVSIDNYIDITFRKINIPFSLTTQVVYPLKKSYLSILYKATINLYRGYTIIAIFIYTRTKKTPKKNIYKTKIICINIWTEKIKKKIILLQNNKKKILNSLCFAKVLFF
jgi:hypothetical protein